jgi:3-oxoacyl-[acyl-carrier protein] reductase
MVSIPGDAAANEAGGKLNEQVAIVTGAGRGIGRAIADELARQGARVVLADIDGALAERAARALADAGYDALGLAVDVSRQSSVEEMIAQTAARWGRIDILVNNAGVNFPAPALEMRAETWQRILDVNLTGAFLCSQAAGRQMAARGYGRIVNLSSTSGHFGAPGLVAYAASKAGLLGLTRVLAVELGSAGVTVNAICPGNIETEMLVEVMEQRAAARGVARAEVIAGIVAKTPAGRLGQPDDVARLAAFLASPEAGYITGQAINLCGGRSIGMY